jgi:hypothetical protein
VVSRVSGDRKKTPGPAEKKTDRTRTQTRGRMSPSWLNMRWGDPLVGRMELYFMVGVAALMAVAYLVRAVVG